MIRLIQWLIFGHIHEWETMETVDLNGGGARGSRVKLKCKKCGDWKKVDLI